MRARAVAIYLTGLALVLCASPAVLRAQDNSAGSGGLESPIGKVSSAAGAVTVEHTAAVVVQANLNQGAVPAKVGDFVYRGDIVQTGTDGQLGLIFSDGTAFNLSTNARMVLNEFVYDPKAAGNSTLFSLVKGNFTFVAGQVAKTGNMRFDTPVATMGIRGTTPRVVIADDGSVTFSTLVEEEVGPVAPGRGAVQRAPSPPVPAANDPFNKKFNLNICRGC